jgi:tRNA(Ile)-lysidine synthase
MNTINLVVNTQKNLLAFSAGVDSTALFYLLVEQNIPFDMAIVDYHQRVQSKDEVIYATQLAHKYNKKCFIANYPNEAKFNEKDARDYRYNFFDAIMIENNYEALLTAHQLNDKCEWFLMQFTKGAGLSELLGMQIESFKNGYKVLKPLLQYTKQSLKSYLIDNKYKFFEDESNCDEKYKRNYFRHNFSDKLLDEFENGISNSFQYLENDYNSLFNTFTKKEFEQLSIYQYNEDLNIAMRIIDKDLKTRGIIISKATRDEILENKEVVISHKIAVAIVDENIFIAPYLKKTMTKEFKERCRVDKIPNNIRGYLSTLERFIY